MTNDEILIKIRNYYEIGEWEIKISIRSEEFEVAKQQVKEAIPEIKDEELNSFIKWYTLELSKQYDTPKNIAEINEHQSKKMSNTITVTCPYCKSTNTKKITNTSKAIHTALFGMWSIGRNAKQWHCNNCKSEF